MGLLLVLVVVWAATGLAIAVWQRRRGHHLLVWVLLGVVYGPITYVLAVDAERRMPTFRETPRVSLPASGQVDVLIGIDGSERSHAAARDALAMIGERRRRVTLAAVINLETGLDAHLGRAEAEEWVEEFADELGLAGVGTVVVSGAPGPALAQLAEEDGYDVVVVGAKGSGLTHRILGSATEQLIGKTSSLVLVGGTAPHLNSGS